MTTPWKTWTRDLAPSTTRTCTFRVSPGRKSGMSERSDAASSEYRVCMAVSSCLMSYRLQKVVPARRTTALVCHRSRVRPNRLLDNRQVGVGQRVRFERGNELRAALRGPSKPLLAAPARDRRVVARGEHRRHIESAP